jgi:hypothetical protein
MPHARMLVVVLGAALLAWPAVGAAQPGCGSGALPACGAPEPAPVTAPTANELVADQWRLLSPVFAALPAGGYAIAFERDGYPTSRAPVIASGRCAATSAARSAP